MDSAGNLQADKRMRHHHGGGAVGGSGNGICHAVATPNQALGTVGTSVQDHAAVTVTVGGPSVMQQLHRSQFSNSGGMFSPGSSGNSSGAGQTNTSSNTPGGPEINLNASAIVATASDCCSGNVMSFEETKQLLAKHLQETSRARSCCQGGGAHNSPSGNQSSHLHVNNSSNNHGYQTSHHAEEPANFDGIDLGGDDQTPVPLGDILDKLQEESDSLSQGPAGSSSNPDDHCKNGSTSDDLNDFIRLHSVAGDHPTISATVNVATLDLSDPDSIHQHLSQLNDTVLRVTTDRLNVTTTSTSSTTDDLFDNTDTINTNTTTDPKQEKAAGQSSKIPISISISNPVSTTAVIEKSTTGSGNETNKNTQSAEGATTPSEIKTAGNGILGTEKTLTISTTTGNSTTTKKTTTVTSPSGTGGNLTAALGASVPTPSRKSGSSSGSKASPQSCSVCSKVFSNASALAKHRLTHSEERRYHCNICGKAFKRQDHLNGHLLTHRSTKPFACHVEGCGKSYCDARSLRRHKENHHGQAKPESKIQATTSDNQQQSDKQSTTNLSLSDNATTSTILSGPDHLISKSSVLGGTGDCTKIKFSSKGLTAQQLQLIEQLFKQSKKVASSSGNSTSTASEAAGSKAASTAIASGSNPPPLNANIKKHNGSGGQASVEKSASEAGGSSNSSMGKSTQQLPDKPVECTICSRKFKNIPALNGHMRLHGGYYKKDADGRRLVGMANTSPLKTVGLNSQQTPTTSAVGAHVTAASAASAATQVVNNKRKASVAVAPGSGDQSSTNSDLQPPAPQKKSCLTPTISVTYCQPQVTSLPSFAFSSLPQPDTSKLLANLEQKAKAESCMQSMGSSSSPGNPGPGSVSSTTTTSEAASAASNQNSNSSSGGNSNTTPSGVVGTNSTNGNPSGSSTTVSSLRALRKPTNASKKPVTANQVLAASNVQQQPQAASSDTTEAVPPIEVPPIASLMNTQPLSLPLVALPTKPLPLTTNVTTTPAEVLDSKPPNLTVNTVTDNHQMMQHQIQNNTTAKSIQITALIQSNPMPGGIGNGITMHCANPSGVSNDFQVLQASTQGPSSNQPGGNLLNVSQDNIPLVNNMLNCMQQSIGGGSITSIPNVNPGAGHPALHHHHHHHHHHQCNQKSRENSAGTGFSSCSNLLKVDETTDKTPKVGEEHQATVSDACQSLTDPNSIAEVDTVMNDIVSDPPPSWHPATAECLSEVELSQYLLVASSCVVGGGSHNEEVALEILQKHEGNVQHALQELLSSYEIHTSCLYGNNEDTLSLFSSQEGSDSEDDLSASSLQPQLPQDGSAHSAGLDDSGTQQCNLNVNLKRGCHSHGQQLHTPQKQPWQPFEVDLFYEGLVRYHKDFNKVSKHVGTKSVKDCVEFYYLWKNICFEESQSFKSLFAQTSSVSGSTMTPPPATSVTASTTSTSIVASDNSSAASGGSSTSSSMTDMTLNHHHHHHHHHHEDHHESDINQAPLASGPLTPTGAQSTTPIVQV